MVRRFLQRGGKLANSPQNSILSAATLIMIMIVVSRILGLIRQRVLLTFFLPESLSLFYAAFRLPDLVFQVLTLGALSSAFIPVFTNAYNKDKEGAWRVAGSVVNLSLIVFVVFAGIFSILAEKLYMIAAPGFDHKSVIQIAYLARVLFAAQGFFVVSYVLTGILESTKRFLIPALAPLFYNLGIIVFTALFSSRLGLLAPALGVVFGALSHLLIQLPSAYRLGFRFIFSLKLTKDVKKIGYLAVPRMVELGILQASKLVELFLASVISTASYTFYNLAISVQALPVGLFGLSLAKAAFPTLASQINDKEKFTRTLFSVLYQVFFLVVPLATLLLVLRIPIIRLLFGTEIFDWSATVQTGTILSVFALGIPFQASVVLLSRAFYALHDTKTPVLVSLGGMALAIVVGILLVMGLSYSTWALALAYSLGNIFQAIVLYILLIRRMGRVGLWVSILPLAKSVFASILAGSVMFFILKFFDRSVWIKRLSFVNTFEVAESIDFERFVLDTRYTVGLVILTVFTAGLGMVVYLGTSYLLGSRELKVLFALLRSRKIYPLPKKKMETLVSTSDESAV